MKNNKKKSQVTFLDNENYRVYASKSGATINILFPSTGEMICLNTLFLQKLVLKANTNFKYNQKKAS